MPSAEYLYATDAKWWQYHIADVMRDFEGELITQRVAWKDIQKEPEEWGIRCFESVQHVKGFCTEDNLIHTGHNSGFAACNVAWHLGYRRVLLLGFDMSMDGERRHFFGDHPDKLNQVSNYQTFMEAFASVDPAQYDMEIWNCSRRTALRHFPIYPLERCLELV